MSSVSKTGQLAITKVLPVPQGIASKSAFMLDFCTRACPVSQHDAGAAGSSHSTTVENICEGKKVLAVLEDSDSHREQGHWYREEAAYGRSTSPLGEAPGLHGPLLVWSWDEAGLVSSAPLANRHVGCRYRLEGCQVSLRQRTVLPGSSPWDQSDLQRNNSNGEPSLYRVLTVQNLALSLIL